MTTSAPALAPEQFQAALRDLAAVRLRSEIELGSLPAPPKLAPWSHALSATVISGGDRSESASGRLVLLHDPNGLEAWDGQFRIVIFVTAEMDEDIAQDPLLPEVAWSWLSDCLAGHQADFTALGGTVTATSSTRFGDIAGPGRSVDLEIRASWTSCTADIGRHLEGFAELLAMAAGLPPEGVSAIGRGGSPNVR